MAATYVTMQELRNSLGIGTLYSDATVEECAQTAQDLINSFLWFNTAPVVATGRSNNVATCIIANPAQFVVGQLITITGSGSGYNGVKTITSTSPYPSSVSAPYLPSRWVYPLGYQYIQFANVAADDPIHLVQPYGLMAGPDDKTATYAQTAAIRSAAMILATNIWQSRQATQNGGMGVDGYAPSPFRMSNTLMASIRGLLAPYLSPGAMVGWKMPPVALTTLRTTIAAALANAGVWSTFSFPPPVILANSVIVAPSDPYLVPSNNSQASIACMANFKVIMTVPYLDNQGNLNGIESTIVAVFNKLASSTLVFNITGASAPSVLDAPSGPMLTSDFSITVLTTWS